MALSGTEIQYGFHPCQPTMSSVEDHRPESRKMHPTQTSIYCNGTRQNKSCHSAQSLGITHTHTHLTHCPYVLLLHLLLLKKLRQNYHVVISLANKKNHSLFTKQQ